jgi:hypothetical protein
MAQTDPPTVAERQRVERLVGSVMAGMDATAAVGTVTDRLGITTAMMLGEASEKVDLEPDGEPVDPKALAHRRYVALSELFEAMAQLAAAKR